MLAPARADDACINRAQLLCTYAGTLTILMAVLQRFQYLGGVVRVGDECSGKFSRRALERFKRCMHMVKGIDACMWIKNRVHASGSRE